MFPWLTIELTSNCNKACSFCGRAKDRKEGILPQGDMPMWMVINIIYGFDGSLVQFNKDGEPLMYEQLGEVAELCRKLTTNIVTNGKLLMERKHILKDNFDTITVSVIEDDEEQFETVKSFVEYTSSPRVLIKFLGSYNNREYGKLGLQTMRRSIHKPEGDTGYKGSLPPVPEFGICLDFLMKPAIDWQGDFHICNRYDPKGLGVIGNVADNNLREIWDSPLRKQYARLHKQGKRDEIELCKSCNYWGCPTSG